MNSYELSRMFWDFAFENPHKIKPYHVAIYFFSIEHCNRLGWKKSFGFPTVMVLEATGMKSYSSYKKYFDQLVDWGFFNVLEYSKNQYSSNIIELLLNVKAQAKASTKALDKAMIKHGSKQHQSTGQSNDSINKQDNNITTEQDNKKQLNNTLLSEIKISDVEDDLKDYFEIAKAFQGLFIKNLTEKNGSFNKQKNAKFKNYVDPIRLMMTSDGITKDQLKTVFSFLSSKQGEFWKSNILSTSKLREKFQQLIMKANERSKTGQANTVGNTGVGAEYLQGVQRDLQS